MREITKEDLILIYLTLQLLITSALYCKQLKQAAYLQGRLDVYVSFAAQETDGTCYARKGSCK